MTTGFGGGSAGAGQTWRAMRTFALLTAIMMSATATGKAAAPAEPWRATGNEPSWALSRSDGEMTLVTDFGASRVTFATPQATKVDDKTVRYVTTVSGEPFELTVKSDVCVDTMTGMPRPEQVTIAHGAKRLTGCGGDPATLLQGREWKVASLAGQPALADPLITMTFASDGRLSGLASCNRFNVSYTLSGEGLSMGKAMSSMMACEPPVMKQEQLFLELIEHVSRFSIGEDGTLVLHSDRDRTIVTKKP